MLKLRGLPFDCTRQDIIDWFSDLPVAPIAPDGCATFELQFPGRESKVAALQTCCMVSHAT